MKSFEVGQVIGRACADESFRARLLANPNEAIKECSIELGGNVNLRVHINSEAEFHIVVPAIPHKAAVANGSEDADNQRGGCALPCRGDNSW